MLATNLKIKIQLTKPKQRPCTSLGGRMQPICLLAQRADISREALGLWPRGKRWWGPRVGQWDRELIKVSEVNLAERRETGNWKFMDLVLHAWPVTGQGPPADNIGKAGRQRGWVSGAAASRSPRCLGGQRWRDYQSSLCQGEARRPHPARLGPLPGLCLEERRWALGPLLF